jgi:HlyD family secretion protein
LGPAKKGEGTLKKRLILIGFVLLFVGVGSLVYWGRYRERSGERYYSGTIEATESNLGFQVSGRVRQILVDEGYRVSKDQLIAVLEQEELLARLERAQADLVRAKASLKEAETFLDLYRSTLPADVERAKAAVNASHAQLAELEAGYRVQEVAQARLKVEETRVAMEKARKDFERFETLFERKIVAEKDADAAELKYETALKEFEQAKQALDMFKEGYRQEDIDAAQSRLVEAQAGLKQATSSLKRIEATEQQVEVAKAQVVEAGAAVEVARIQLQYSELRAPYAGIVVSRNMEPGEVVSPAEEVLSLSDLSMVKLKIFVDETEIGNIKPGQRADVKIDTFPDKVYPGTVGFISPEAEFTPKIIQTHKERVKLVYLVKIFIPNPDLTLKSGMPADAWLKPEIDAHGQDAAKRP